MVGLRARVKAAEKIVSYVTDIEGSWDYWLRFLFISHAFEYKGEFEYDLKKNAHLVFGGDVCDRGRGDLRVLDALNGLKEKYPDRVHFIIGNRDCNKLRLPFELSNQQLQRGIKVYWIKEVRDCADSAPERLKWLLKNTMGSPHAFEERRKELEELNIKCTDDAVVESFLESLQPEGRLIKYLKHAEIGVIIGDSLFIHGGITSDNMRFLPPDYATAIPPDHPQLHHTTESPLPLPPPPLTKPSPLLPMPSYRDPSSGGISGAFTTGTSRSNSSVGIDENINTELSLDEWCKQANTFAAKEMNHYLENRDSYIAAGEEPWSITGGYDHEQPGSRLIQMGMGFMPDEKPNHSVIYSCFLKKGAPDLEKNEKNLESFLSTSDVVRVLVGHQPIGDVPMLMKGKNANIQVLSCDTSYSSNVVWELPYPDELVKNEVEKKYQEYSSKFPISSPTDSRGVAVSEVLLLFQEGDNLVADTYMHGILSNGLYYESEIPAPNLKNEIIGQVVGDGWLVRCQVEIPVTSPPAEVVLDTDATKTATTVDDTSTACNLTSRNEGTTDLTNSTTVDTFKIYYVLCKLEGYQVNNKIVSQEELQKLLYHTTTTTPTTTTASTDVNDIKILPPTPPPILPGKDQSVISALHSTEDVTPTNTEIEVTPTKVVKDDFCLNCTIN